MNQQYKKQVNLLLDVIPFVAKRDCFALKGGTALNMFIWNMPRLSVDIDLVYLPVNKREYALKEIKSNLCNIRRELENSLKIKVILTENNKLFCSRNDIMVKIEVNPVIRSSLFLPQNMSVVDAIQNDFEKFASIKVLNQYELYGSKICAALDRQHPRDIFDFSKILEEGQGNLNEETKKSFIFYLLSHNRPINEIISSNINDRRNDFHNQFQGMTKEAFNYDDFFRFSSLLREKVKNLFNNKDKEFILGFKNNRPNWELFGQDLSRFPSIKWKLSNIAYLMANNPKKHLNMLKKLEITLR